MIHSNDGQCGFPIEAGKDDRTYHHHETIWREIRINCELGQRRVTNA
jgi:hypothetical protein